MAIAQHGHRAVERLGVQAGWSEADAIEEGRRHGVQTDRSLKLWADAALLRAAMQHAAIYLTDSSVKALRFLDDKDREEEIRQLWAGTPAGR